MNEVMEVPSAHDTGVTVQVSVEAGQLATLLEGALTHSDKGPRGVESLMTVHVEAGLGYFTARATDRYRLIEGKIESEHGELPASLIGAKDVKRIISLLADKGRTLVTLTRLGDEVQLSTGADSMTVQALDSRYSYPKEFDSLLNNPTRAELGEVAFNPALFADYGKIAGKKEAVRVEFIGENKPMLIHLPITNGVEWRALLMPMKSAK